MTTVTKITTGVAGVSTLGGGVALGVSLFKEKQTVSTRLVAEGFDVNVTDFGNLLTKHNLAKEPNIFVDTSVTTKDTAWLQTQCKRALEGGIKDEKNYKLARQWCVKERAISDIFGSIGLKALDNTGNRDDNGTWKTHEVVLKKDVTTAGKLSETMKGDTTITVANIKSACTALIAINTTDKDFNDKFELSKTWCAVKDPKKQK
ncbi:hypothetical protein A6V39_04500 [Candidatus Mycoplasma haematobovis]|uniref:Uncharacterized protein n=1 Tax=Candidatus Mycoplasma haematobovis TaxID=432608 RepID=A0A1A9QDX5_9MOLU|nr:hypothetical protein [Candidatus Mycoplasma haematobovis]OAL10145.1 hypothetical protein A6V39_04500 [Candidatus Mycoplasma haematobovis]